MKLTTHPHIAPKLKMSGAVPLFPLYALMTRKGTTLPLPLAIIMMSLTLFEDDV